MSLLLFSDRVLVEIVLQYNIICIKKKHFFTIFLFDYVYTTPQIIVANETIIELQKLPQCDYEVLNSLSRLYTKLALSIQKRLKSQSDIIDMDRQTSQLARNQKQSELLQAIEQGFVNNNTDYGNS